MAEGQDDRDTEDLSEEASPYRLEDFRRKGRVSQSRELSGLIALLGTGVALYMAAPFFGRHLIVLMEEIFSMNFASLLKTPDNAVIFGVLGKSVKLLAFLGLPVAIAGFILGILSSYVQIGSVFSTEPLSPDLERINPIKGIQRFFSLKQVFDGVRLILRTLAVAFVGYLFVKAAVLGSPRELLNDPAQMLDAYSHSGKTVFPAICGVLLFFAAIDFWIQRWEFSKSVRLTKKEQKEEHKEHEGDPLIKARIRAIQRDAARKRMMEAVKTADVVVTNPTHIAVALKYQKEKMNAPKVVAKGADFLAQKIKQIAADSGIPTVENVPLARSLFKVCKVGQVIPKNLYQAVAEILAYVYRLKNRKWEK